jgi:hypothetical protein
MPYLDIHKLTETEVQRAPFEFLTVPAFVSGDRLVAVNRDFPKLDKTGNFPVEELEYGPGFAAFIAEIRGPEFRKRNSTCGLMLWRPGSPFVASQTGPTVKSTPTSVPR